MALARAEEIENPLRFDNLLEVIGGLSNFFFTLALFLLPVIIVTGGIFFITAGGNPSKIETGKKIITLGIIGFIITLAANGFINLLRNVFLGR